MTIEIVALFLTLAMSFRTLHQTVPCSRPTSTANRADTPQYADIERLVTSQSTNVENLIRPRRSSVSPAEEILQEEEEMNELVRTKTSTDGVRQLRRRDELRLQLERRRLRDQMREQAEASRDCQQAEMHSILTQAKSLYEQLTTDVTSMPWLPGFTDVTNLPSCPNIQKNLPQERLDRWALGMMALVESLCKVMRVGEIELFALDVVGSDDVKSALWDFVSHEQKQMMMCTQVFEDIQQLESLLSGDASSTLGLTGQKMTVLRDLKASAYFLERLTYRHTQLFVETQNMMASWYQKLTEHLYAVQPHRARNIPVPLPSHQEAFEYRKPLNSLVMKGTMERVCQVKSYIWVCFSDGMIRVVTPSHRDLPLFKSLREFPAHSSSIHTILYVPPRTSGSGTVWTAGHGSLRIWHPDTANQISQVDCDIPLSALVLLEQGERREIWGSVQEQAQIQIWNAESLESVRQLILPELTDILVRQMIVRMGHVFLLGYHKVVVLRFDGTIAYQWPLTHQSLRGSQPQIVSPTAGLPMLFDSHNRLWDTHGGSLAVWQVEEEKISRKLRINLLRTIEATSRATYFIETHFTEEIIWVARSDKTILLYDSKTCRAIGSIELLSDMQERVVDSLCIGEGADGLLVVGSHIHPDDSDTVTSRLGWYQRCSSFQIE